MNGIYTNRCKLQLRQYSIAIYSHSPMSWGWCCTPISDNPPLPVRSRYHSPGTIAWVPHDVLTDRKVLQQEADRAMKVRLSSILDKDQLIMHPEHHRQLQKAFFKGLIVCFSTLEEFEQLISRAPQPTDIRIHWELSLLLGNNSRKRQDEMLGGQRATPQNTSDPMISFPEQHFQSIRHISISLQNHVNDDLAKNGPSRANDILKALGAYLKTENGKNNFRNLVSIELDGSMGVGDFIADFFSRGWYMLNDDNNIKSLVINLWEIRRLLPHIEIPLRGPGCTKAQLLFYTPCISYIRMPWRWVGRPLFQPMEFKYTSQDVVDFREGRKFAKAGPLFG